MVRSITSGDRAPGANGIADHQRHDVRDRVHHRQPGFTEQRLQLRRRRLLALTLLDLAPERRSEALDLLNGVLTTRGFTLIRRNRMLVCADISKGIPTGLVSGLEFSPDGSRLAAIVAPSYGRWTVAVDGVPWSATFSTLVSDATFSPDGQRIAALAKDDETYRVLVDGSALVTQSRMIRELVGLLDEWVPVVQGSEIHDDPFAPVSAEARTRLAEQGDEQVLGDHFGVRRRPRRLGGRGEGLGGLQRPAVGIESHGFSTSGG